MKSNRFRTTTEGNWIISLVIFVASLVYGMTVQADRITDLEEQMEILHPPITFTTADENDQTDGPWWFVIDATVSGEK